MVGHHLLRLILMTALATAALVAGNADAQTAAPPEQPPAPVQVAAARQDDVGEQITLVGTVEPNARSTVAAEIAGLVEVYSAREGRFVEKGQVLATLNDTALQLRLKAATAGRDKIRANLDNAAKEMERLGKLNTSDSIAESQFDTVRFNHQAIASELRRSQFEIEQIAHDIGRSKVAAPFSGFVVKEHTQVGQWIGVGGPVVTLVDLTTVKVRVDLPERYLAGLVPSGHGEVQVVITALAAETQKAKVDAVLADGNPGARTFAVIVVMDNPGQRIKGGMEAVVSFALAGRRQALLVPKDAVVNAGDSRLVYTVADNRANPVTVTVAGYYGSNVAVEGPLKAGDTVVVRGNERLRPGQPVRVIP